MSVIHMMKGFDNVSDVYVFIFVYMQLQLV